MPIEFLDEQPTGRIEFIDEPQQPERAQPKPSTFDTLANIGTSALKGATMGLGEELIARAASISPNVTYEQALEFERQKQRQFKEQQSWTAGISEAGGAITGGLGAGVIAAPTKAAQALSQLGGTGRIATGLKASGLGGVSGGLYAYGSGEGGAGQRLAETPAGMAYGAGGGLVGLGVAKAIRPLTERANKLYNRVTNKSAPIAQPQATPQEIVNTLAERQLAPEAIEDIPKAYGKVAKQLKQDFGQDFDTALEAYKSGDISLAELYGKRTSSLAQGAAVYPSGRAVAEDFLDKKVGGSYDRVLSSIRQNVSGVDNYFTTADDLINAGRAKAAPQYANAYEDSLKNNEILQTKEIQDALAKAYKKYPSDLKGVKPNSIQALDYAKKVLDDDIGKAVRQGESNFVRSRTVLKNALLEEMDNASPAYKEARTIAGDYISVNNAMEEGRKALKTDSEALGKIYKSLNNQEKQAYKIGLGKALRDEIGKVNEGANPYKKILGSPEKTKRIASVLSPEEFKNFEMNLKAEDRLFQFRNKVLAGSPTADKLEAQNLIESGAVQSLTNVPQANFTQALKQFSAKLIDGLNDKTASKVSEILYETNPIKKLQILDKMKSAKNFTKQDRELVEQAYALIAPKFDALKLSPALAGGAIAAPNEPDMIDAQGNEYSWENK